jgi:rhamnogalacturonyl hydrolase YesR
MLDATDAPRWEYTPGLVLKAVQGVYERTGESATGATSRPTTTA